MNKPLKLTNIFSYRKYFLYFYFVIATDLLCCSGKLTEFMVIVSVPIPANVTKNSVHDTKLNRGVSLKKQIFNNLFSILATTFLINCSIYKCCLQHFDQWVLQFIQDEFYYNIFSLNVSMINGNVKDRIVNHDTDILKR